jgi:hypothetical protein
MANLPLALIDGVAGVYLSGGVRSGLESRRSRTCSGEVLFRRRWSARVCVSWEVVKARSGR